MNITGRQQKEFEALTANLGPVSEEKQALLYTRLDAFNQAKGSVTGEGGKALFLQHCAACHSLKNEGGAIGPQLDGVGKWDARALAEKILDPNRNISEAFRNYVIKLKDGKVLSGLYRREEGEVLVFADVSGREFTVPKKEIAEQKASNYTLMPDHFGNLLSQEEFNALLNFLLEQKAV